MKPEAKNIETDQEQNRDLRSKSDCGGLLGRMRALEVDHDPDGWPAVRMKDISTLCQMIDGAKALRNNPNRLHWNPDGYWLDGVFVGDLESAFYIAEL